MGDGGKPVLMHLATVALSFYYASQFGQMRYMKDNGFDVIVAACPDDLLDRYANSLGVPAVGIEIERNRISLMEDLRSIWKACREFRRLKPDILHAHSPKGGLVAMLGGFIAGVPVRVYHMHGLIHLSREGLAGKFLYLCERISCSLAHRVYFVSPSNLEIAVQDGLCTREKARVLCNGSINGVDAEGKFNPARHDRDAIRKTLGIPVDAPVVGFVGRVINGKGIKELVQAWDELQETFPGLYLLVVGPMEVKDAIPPDVRRRIVEDDHIRYAGEVEDTSPFYAAMDVLAFPTYRDGFGLVAIEASAMEVPVIASKIHGVIDAVADEVTGILIPPADSSALKSAMSRYLCDPVLRRTHGSNGRKRVLADFRPEEIWKAQHEDYMQLLRERCKGAR